MPQEKARVIKTFGDRALVRTRRGSMCDGCGHSGACQVIAGGDVVEMEVFNKTGASVGDTVVVELSDSVFLGASVAVYFVPIVGFVAGAFTVRRVASGANADLWAFLGGLAVCAAMFLLVRVVLQLFPGHKEALMPVIVAWASDPPVTCDEMPQSSGAEPENTSK